MAPRQRRYLAVCAALALIALMSGAGCIEAENIRADRDWYTLKEATNGRNMVLASWRLCQSDPSCTPSERADLEGERERVETEYQKAQAAVDYDHAHGWYADVNSLPKFARDPSLGLTP